MIKRIAGTLEERREAFAKLVIINKIDMPFDGDATMLFHEKIGDVLPPVVRRPKNLLGLG